MGTEQRWVCAALKGEVDRSLAAVPCVRSLRLPTRLTFDDPSVFPYLNGGWYPPRELKSADASEVHLDNGLHREPGVSCGGRCLSRALEMNPETGEIVWHFQYEKLFSQGFGDVDRLANGNTLVSFGQRHPHATLVEVTAGGEVIWTLDSNIVTEALGLKRPMIYRAQRVDSLPQSDR